MADSGLNISVEPHTVSLEVLVHDVQKPVREFLRSADVLLELLRNGAELPKHEVTILQAYITQLRSFLVVQEVRDGRAKDGLNAEQPASNTAKSDGR
jgi:hypothetical protein